MTKRVFSGIQPTGEIHMGNYFGAIKNWVGLPEKYECIFCIVDYHAITIPYNTATMKQNIINAAKVNIACGISPEKSLIFVQSHVKEHTELAWIFNCITPLGLLERMTQFKDKSAQHRQEVNLGLLAYPVLQAADILLYKAELVPVGEDQVQHIELSRDIARKFNLRFGDYFPEPKELLTPTARIMGLDAENKMSKSKGNTIGVVEDPVSIQNKLNTAVTDTNRKRKQDPGNPDICNLYSYHKLVSTNDEMSYVSDGCKNASIGCVECKKILGKNMINTFAPIREKYLEISQKDDYIIEVLHEGAKKATIIAQKTMNDIREIIGV